MNNNLKLKNTSDSGKTVGQVLNTLNYEQRKAVSAVIFDLLSEIGRNIEAKKSDDESETDDDKDDSLKHHGILGQKWGKRNGPPYPLSGGQYTKDEKEEIYNERSKSKNSIYNKKHFDEVLKKNEIVSTLSYDPNRTDNTDMFFAATNYADKNQYRAMFNKPIPKDEVDENGNVIGSSMMLKYSIDNKVVKDIRIASEDSGSKVFESLYANNRDFKNFVTDPERLRSYFVDDKYKFRGYRESRDVLKKMDREDYIPSQTDIRKLYRMFNYVIPYDGGGSDKRGAHDVSTQRAKFFKKMKEEGYSAILDTNDSIYGGFKAKSPVIIFDHDAIVKDSVRRTTMNDKRISIAVTAVNKALGIYY